MPVTMRGTVTNPNPFDMSKTKNVTMAKAIEVWPVDRLIPYARNARTHDTAQIDKIASSILEFGFTNPILVDEKNGIIAGHGRLMAAKKVGLAEVPVIALTHMSDAQRRAYILADNRLALDAGWDEALLSAELADLQEADFDLSLIGFSDEELANLLPEDDEDGAAGSGEDDNIPEPPYLATSVPGDVWICGRHRVMCGDSTSIDAVDRLMNDESVDLIFTDPPYNVAFNGRSGKHDVIKNDDLEEQEFDQFIGDVLQTIKAINAPNYYIWCNWKFYGTLQRELSYKACIVWAKNSFGMGTNYRHQHEFCLFNGAIDDHILNESDLWQVAKDTNYVHPTQKPVALSERALGNHREAKNVLDLFGGSGSTLIGCEKMKRNGFIMELDPKYADVIVKRWQDFSGKQAVHEESSATFDELVNDRKTIGV